MRPPQGPAARAAPPPAPPSGRFGAPEADGTREHGSGGARLGTRGAGYLGLSGEEVRGRRAGGLGAQRAGEDARSSLRCAELC